MSRYPSSWSWDFSAIVGVGNVHENATIGLGSGDRQVEQERSLLMASNPDKIAARKAIQQAHAERVRLRRERETQLEQLAIQVGASLAAGRRALAEAEAAAGRALNQMIDQHGLGVREVQEWCAVELTPREIARLRRAAGDGGDSGGVA